MTEKEVELRRELKDDFQVYAHSCLKIRTKTGQISPLILNRSQLYLHEKLEEQKRKTGRVRALILKGRQIGASTYVAARFYHSVTHHKGYRVFILAHLDLASDNLFNLIKRYHENCPDLVRPQTGTSNAKELSFHALDGGVKVATAGSKDVGRSETIQLFLGSEFGFWPNASTHFSGIMQALADEPDTECILESTANGVSNAFHTLWAAAERGESDFISVFIPWFWSEDYVAAPPADWVCPEAFIEYQNNYELTDEQTYWAFRKNRQLAQASGESTDELCFAFKQEFPSHAAEAFQTGGTGSFIKAEGVVKARKAKHVGYGPIVLGVDPARGGGDQTGIVSRQGRVLGEHVCKRINLDDLMAVAGEIQKLVREIKPQKIIIDTTGLGAGLYDRLLELLGRDMVEGVNFGSKAFNFQHYANRRVEIWDALCKWFEDEAGVSIPDSDELQGDLCAPASPGTIPGGTRFNSNGQLLLEAKDHLKARLTFSPDLGDAAALTFAVDLSAAKIVDWGTGAIPAGGWQAG